MLGKEVKTRLSLLQQDIVNKIRQEKIVYFKGNREINFGEGEKVWMEEYKNTIKPTWKTVKITKLGENYPKREDKKFSYRLLQSSTFYEKKKEFLYKG